MNEKLPGKKFYTVEELMEMGFPQTTVEEVKNRGGKVARIDVDGVPRHVTNVIGFYSSQPLPLKSDE